MSDLVKRLREVASEAYWDADGGYDSIAAWDAAARASLNAVLDDLRKYAKHGGEYQKYGGDWNEALAFLDAYKKD